jgi:AcrR family transcriptional regulator
MVYFVNVIHEAQNSRPQSRRRQRNLARILDAATGLVVESGFDALSIKQVAEEADYTAGAIYRYFPSKDALLGAVMARLMASLADALERVDALAGNDEPLVRIVARVDAYRAYSAIDSHRFALIATMLAEGRVRLVGREEVGPVLDVARRLFLPLVVALTEAVDAKLLSLGSATERAILLFSSTQGILQLRKQERLAIGTIETDRLCLAGLRTLLIGWGAETITLDAAMQKVSTMPIAAELGAVL